MPSVRSIFAAPAKFTRMTFVCLFLTSFPGCKSGPSIYKSACDANVTFKKVDFTQLIDHIQKYDHQYVEVKGVYREAKEQSALFNDSLFVDHSDQHALWINFSQDCPLYLEGTRQGLFEVNSDGFISINNKSVTIRGRVDLHNTGHKGRYKGTLDRVSFFKL